MCRLAGIYDLNSADLRDNIIRMRDSMKHGGPDDEGIYIDETFPLALGHRRLSFLDLSSAGHQPMSDNDNNFQLIFNGEIYNFQELRSELQSVDYIFKTGTDTEVILKAFQQWGIKCFERFNGMFALALWDKRKQQLILARDHAGIKPLYYSITNDRLIFASEIRAFKSYDKNWPENNDWKIAFLLFGHLPEPFTTLQNVQQLAKGTCAVIDIPSLEIKINKFNQFSFSSTINDLSSAIDLIKDKLERSVERHLISDAPIGLFLSGGIDSSLLTLIAQKYIGNNLKTLSIIFDDTTLNEQPYQKIIIDKTGAHHQSFLVTEKDFQIALPDILEAMDQPSTDGINSYFICKYAKQYGLKAVLSGLGADELFGGYSSFGFASKASLIQKLPSFIPGLTENFSGSKIKKISFLKRADHAGEYLFYRGFYSVRQVSELLSVSEKEVQNVLDNVSIDKINKNEDHRNRVSHLETNLYMQNQLLKDTDSMSMWHSVEVRVPFLDKDLMNVAYSIAPEIKFDKKIPKHLLIKAFDDVLPKEIWQRKKQGFTFPFYKWMKNIKPNERDTNYRQIQYSFKKNQLHWSRYWAYVLLGTKDKIKYYSPCAKDFLFMNLSAFSLTGGIEKFNRCFLKSLQDIEAEGNLTADAMSLHDTKTDERYFRKGNYTSFSGNKIKFVSSAVRNSKYYDVVITGHINLSLPLLIIKILKGKKLILIAHGIEVWKPLKGIKKALLKRADLILAVSRFTKDQIIKLQGIAENKVSIFHNALDPYFKIPDQLSSPVYLKKRYNLNGQKIIYTLTRLSSKEKYKGYDKVLQALAEIKKVMPEFKYIISGKADDTERARVESLIKKLGLEKNVLLTGFIQENEIVDHYLLADTFIMPSTMEGFGIVFIEAMACGLPVIAGNIDGSVDALCNGKLGVLINPYNKEEINCSIKKVIENKAAFVPNRDLFLNQFSYPVYKNNLKNILLNNN